MPAPTMAGEEPPRPGWVLMGRNHSPALCSRCNHEVELHEGMTWRGSDGSGRLSTHLTGRCPGRGQSEPEPLPRSPLALQRARRLLAVLMARLGVDEEAAIDMTSGLALADVESLSTAPDDRLLEFACHGTPGPHDQVFPAPSPEPSPSPPPGEFVTTEAAREVLGFGTRAMRVTRLGSDDEVDLWPGAWSTSMDRVVSFTPVEATPGGPSGD